MVERTKQETGSDFLIPFQTMSCCRISWLAVGLSKHGQLEAAGLIDDLYMGSKPFEDTWVQCRDAELGLMSYNVTPAGLTRER
jgi:hypothetical protein